MKKKRFLPMCLCLVLALGLAACNDLEDLADSGGDDETSETSPTETGDGTEPTEPSGGEGPSESIPTYSIQIVDPSGDLQLEVGESATIAVSLVTTVDNTDSSVAGTASEVTLSSSDSSVVSVEGLTITALAVGEAVITATWTEHGVTSSGLAVTVTEPAVTPNPDVITYKVVITSPESGDEIEIDTETEVSVNLITITNGEEGEPVAATSSDVTIKESGSSILSINELTITGLVEGEATIIATWKDHIEATDSITITIKNSNPSSGEGGEDVTTYGVSITSPASSTVLKVGDTLNVEASLITYTNGSETSTAAATYSDVTLTQSGNGSVTISNDSLTITGATAGDVTLTVTWTDHVGVTGTTASASVTFKVESVYTYKAVITAPTSGTSIEVDETTNIVVLLYTTIDGVEQSPVTAGADDISLTQSGAGAVSFDGLSVKGVTAGEVTITATWIGHEDASDCVTITVTEPEPVFESYTYEFKLLNSSGDSLGDLPSNLELYAAGDFDTYYNGYEDKWTIHEVKATSTTDIYTMELDFIPTVGTYFNIYLHDTTTGNEPDTDMWGHYIAYHSVSDYDISSATGTTNMVYSLDLWIQYSSWSTALAGSEGETGGEGGGTITLTIHFVDNLSSPSQYYGLPTYPAAESDYQEVVAYLVLIDSDSKWTNPGEYNQYHKLIAVSSNPSDGYTVDISDMAAGTYGCLVYFEWASEEANNKVGDITDWSHHYPSSDSEALSLTITEDMVTNGGTPTLNFDCDPSTIIYPPSEGDIIDVVIGVHNTGTASATSQTFYLNSWIGSNSTTGYLSSYSGAYSSQIDQAITVSGVNKTSDDFNFALYIGTDSGWGYGLGSSGSITWSEDTYYIGCTTESAGPTWSINFGDFTTNNSTKLNGVTTFYVIFNFDFSSVTTSSSNAGTQNNIITANNISFITAS